MVQIKAIAVHTAYRIVYPRRFAKQHYRNIGGWGAEEDRGLVADQFYRNGWRRRAGD
jgi:hypothetical protein